MSKEFSWSVRVYYEDTDAGGVVYYANYFKYMERARTEWLRSLGFAQRKLVDTERLGFVVTHASAQYKKPARLDDLLTVSAKIAAVRGTRIKFDQDIHDDNGALLCAGRVAVACLDMDSFSPRPVPEAIRSTFATEDH